MQETPKKQIRLRDWAARCRKDYALLAVYTGIPFGAMSVFFIPLGIGFLASAFTENNGSPLLTILFIAAALLFWTILAVVFAFFYRNLSAYLALKNGNFRLETDQVTRRVAKEHTSGSIDRKTSVHYVAYFKQYGKHTLYSAPYADQTFYLLVLNTKKPRIVDYYDTDKYEILER
ncbi:MAG: hypothetical protein J6V39_02900, partial [Clostridia bacterium]|nr:hypothetical protein [Clostridia bacterium]